MSGAVPYLAIAPENELSHSRDDMRVVGALFQRIQRLGFARRPRRHCKVFRKQDATLRAV